MVYITKALARVEEDSISAANGVTDEVLEAIIFNASEWINNTLDADTGCNEYGETVYIDFQYSDSDSNSYCLEDQHKVIVDIATWETCAQALVVKKDAGATPKVVHLDAKRPIIAYDDYETNRKAKEYHKRALTGISALIAQDKQYGHFLHSRKPTGGTGFIVVNRKKRKRIPTVEEIVEMMH